jgi:hypothetical protein
LRWDDEGNIFRDISEITYIHTYKCKRWKKIINESHLRRKEKIKNDEELVDRIDRIDRLYILRHYIYIYIYKWWKDVKNFPPKRKRFSKKK